MPSPPPFLSRPLPRRAQWIVLRGVLCPTVCCCGAVFGYWDTSFRVSANVHMLPTVFCLSACVSILFWSGASKQSILASGAIPAHIIFLFICFHVFLYRVTVAPCGIVSPLVTGLLYLFVTGIYTLGNGGVGPYEPESDILNWQTGLTAAAVFIGLAIIIVFFAILYFFSAWRDRPVRRNN